jgi:hypothetical protein
MERKVEKTEIKKDPEEDEGCGFPRNVLLHSLDYTALYPSHRCENLMPNAALSYIREIAAAARYRKQRKYFLIFRRK